MTYLNREPLSYKPFGLFKPASEGKNGSKESENEEGNAPGHEALH